ncbi:hypothetical protein PanWU01x14_227670 [Parasponia andersonii]|uniref:Uncharacterized protein n=1 Tax=Parasponia andersonii TaxID=3476 RepID=A0A2P5BLY4_PARAD|nr:hypothetical protein PanWU01x14_227670 [Parasponia andersonii]
MDSAQSDSYLDSWGVRSPKGLPPEYNGKQLTAPDPDKAFNAIVSRCAQRASRPDRTAICPNLAPDRLEPLETAETRLQRYRGDHGNLGP